MCVCVWYHVIVIHTHTCTHACHPSYKHDFCPLLEGTTNSPNSLNRNRTNLSLLPSSDAHGLMLVQSSQNLMPTTPSPPENGNQYTCIISIHVSPPAPPTTRSTHHPHHPQHSPPAVLTTRSTHHPHHLHHPQHSPPAMNKMCINFLLLGIHSILWPHPLMHVSL